jgi:hypothetical protein
VGKVICNNAVLKNAQVKTLFLAENDSMGLIQLAQTISQ